MELIIGCIYIPPAGYTFKTDAWGNIPAEGISDDEIAYSYDEIKMFVFSDQKWIEVDDFANGASGFRILSPLKWNINNVDLTSLSPILPDSSQSVTLWVVIIGHVMRNGEITNELTADYIDVILEP